MPRPVPLAVSLLLTPLYVWTAFDSFRELFVSAPGKHFARVGLESEGFHATRVQFFLNTPTVGTFVMLLGALVALVGVIAVVAIAIRPAWRRWLIAAVVVQGSGLLVAIVAYLVVLEEFLSNAGDFG